MPCLCRMKKYIIHGLLWLYIISTGLFVVSLEPGYLDFDNLPDTNFSCVGKVIGGYYADLETNCQMFHVCTIGQLDEPMDIRFLCLNGTVFDQETRVCERIDEVDCSKSEKFYSLNLELYGNTAPPILEENAETEPSIVEKPVSSTTTTTTTTTTTPKPTTTATTVRTQYFTSSQRPATPSPYHKGPSPHHFSIEQSPGYSPEEINISLNPGAPPNIRTKPFEFPQHKSFSDNNDKTVSTSRSVFKSDEEEHSKEDNSRYSSSTTESVKNNYKPNLQHTQPSQNSFKYNFNYHDTRPRDFNPSRSNNYQYHHNYGNFRPYQSVNNPFENNSFRSSTQRTEYLPVTRKNFEVNHPSSTSRSFFLQPIKSPSHQYFTRTEKPQGNQLPIPVLPTLSPIVFSSPAPFTLSRHVETKRYTDEHELPPRIIISASASVSDASGRTLNYSLGTIGAAQILAQPPASYDDYKEEDVVLDPFYHDVPKLQNDGRRTKRETMKNEKDYKQSDFDAEGIYSTKLKRTKRAPQNVEPSEIIKTEEEAVEVLKFLFDWYKTHEKTTRTPIDIPVSPELISTINEEFSQRPYVAEDYEVDSQHPENSATSMYPSDNNGKNSYSNYLIHQAAREPSSAINKNQHEFVDAKPTIPSIETDVKYPSNDNFYRNTPNPPDQQLNYRKITKSANRGRHRFTWPYSTTENAKLQENLSIDRFKNRKRVQTSSQIHNEEFYEPQKEIDDFDSMDKRYDVPHSSETYTENSKWNERLNSIFSSKDPSLYISSATPQQIEFKEEKVETTPQFSIESENYETQNLSRENTANYETTTSQYNSESTNYNDKTFNQNTSNAEVTTSLPHFTNYRNNIELKSTKTESSTINVYDYVDDNYEPEVYSESIEYKDNQDKLRDDEVRGIIHEETNINIQPPEETTTNTYNIDSTTSANTIGDSINSPNHNNLSKNSIALDENSTSFISILNTLQNLQKTEQNIYNYEQNLTEIKQFKPEELYTTRIEETSTLPPYTEDSTELKQAINDTGEIKELITTENDNSSYGNEAGYSSSINFNYETTPSSHDNDEPHLYTSKLFDIKTDSTTSEGTTESTEEIYEAKTTDALEEEINSEDSMLTKQSYEGQEVTTPLSSTTPDISNKQTINSDSYYTTITESSVEIDQEEKLMKTTPYIKYKNKMNGLARPNYSRGRVVNTPVSSTTRFSLKGRNTRRKQNKPLFIDNKTITSISASTVDHEHELLPQKTSVPYPVTENVINIEKLIPNDIQTEISSENIPLTYTVNIKEKGFYVTKQHGEIKYGQNTKQTSEPELLGITETNSINDKSTTYNPETVEIEADSPQLSEKFENYAPEKMRQNKKEISTENIDESSTVSSLLTEQFLDTSKIEEAFNFHTTEINEDISSTTPTSATYSTLSIKEIETVTNNIATIQSDTKLQNAFNQKNDDHTEFESTTTEIYSTSYDEKTKTIEEINENMKKGKNIESLTTKTDFYSNTGNLNSNYEKETTQMSINQNEINNLITETTTEFLKYDTESTSARTIADSANEDYTAADAETTVPTIEETTLQVQNTKFDNTQTNLARTNVELSTKSTLAKEIVSEKTRGYNLRDGRKFNSRKYKQKPEGSRRYSPRHRFGSTDGKLQNSKYERRHFSNTSEKNQSIHPKEEFTEINLSKNVKPTSESKKDKNISTTPMLYKVQLRKEKVNKQFVFNCFGKPLNQFYSDPRDCRLFHYCTNGYSKNQLLDMKFVCDLGTHFDDEKLVCTREIPERCL